MRFVVTTIFDVDMDDLRKYTGDNLTDDEAEEYVADLASLHFEKVVEDELGRFAWHVSTGISA